MVSKSTEGKIEKTTVACVPFFTMGQKNNTSICLHNNSVFFFFLKRYFLGFLLCIKTITPDQRHFVLVTFLLVSIFLCRILIKLLICFATWCPSLHQCVFLPFFFFLQTSAQAIFILIFDFCFNFFFVSVFFFHFFLLFSRMLFRFLFLWGDCSLGRNKVNVLGGVLKPPSPVVL